MDRRIIENINNERFSGKVGWSLRERIHNYRVLETLQTLEIITFLNLRVITNSHKP